MTLTLTYSIDFIQSLPSFLGSLHFSDRLDCSFQPRRPDAEPFDVLLADVISERLSVELPSDAQISIAANQSLQVVFTLAVLRSREL